MCVCVCVCVYVHVCVCVCAIKQVPLYLFGAQVAVTVKTALQALLSEAAVPLWLEHWTADRDVPSSTLSCCCFLEQGTLLTLLQSTQLY